MGRSESQPIDRGWAWMIVVATLFSGFCMIGTAKSFGLIADELKDYFEAPQYMVSMVFGVSAFIYTISAPAALILGEIYSQRVVVMVGGVIGCIGIALSCLCLSLPYVICTFGICFGIGNGFLYGNCLVMIGKYFKKRRSLANGIALSGSSIGQFALPPLIQFLINYYTIKGALLILGGIYFNIFGFGSLLRPVSWYKQKASPKSEVENGQDGDQVLQEITDESKKVLQIEIEDSSLLKTKQVEEINEDRNHKKGCKIPAFLDFSILKNPKCLLYCFSMFTLFFGYFNFILFLPSIAKEGGIGEYEKAYLVSICGISDLLGRLIFGVISDLGIIQRYQIMSWCGMIVGIDILVFVSAHAYWQMALQSAIYGFLGGAYIMLVSLVLIDFLGLELLPKALSPVLFLQGLGGAIGQIFLGWVRDRSGNFISVLIICGVNMLIGGLALQAYPLLNKWEKKRKKELNTSSQSM